MAAGDLTTVDRVRTFLGIQTTEADDKLAWLVTVASTWVVSQVGRSFLSGSYAETYSGDGTQTLVLDHYPVASVTTLTVDGSAIPARATVDDTGYVIDGSTLKLSGYYFTSGLENVSVVYTAGMAVPPDIEQATVEFAALKFRQADRQGLTTASIAGESVGFDSNREWASIQTLLDPYREMFVA